MLTLRNLFLLLVLLCIPVFTWAQTVPGGNTFIRTEPKYPIPGQKVLFQLTSYEGSLDTALITWFQDGKLLERGRGLSSITITAPKNGTRSKIVANADLVNGRVIASEITLAPSSATILIQAQTHTPPFYKGKAIPTVGGEIYLIAVPEFYGSDGKSIDPDLLSYEWWADTGELSATNGRSVVLKNSIFMRTARVALTVKGPNGLSASSNVVIPARTPSLVLYANDPSLGIWYNASVPPSFSLNNSEISLHAEPFFFSKDIVPNLQFDWTPSGSLAPYRSADSRLVIRPEEGATGLSIIELFAHSAHNNLPSMFQQAKTSFSVRYNSESRSGTSTPTSRQGSGSVLPQF